MSIMSFNEHYSEYEKIYIRSRLGDYNGFV